MTEKVLFVCVHHTGRSQMAEAFARRIGDGALSVRSADTVPGGELNLVVAMAMRERGIDMSAGKPKVIDQAMVDEAERVITMSCSIDETCPAAFIPLEDWGLDDPAGQPIDVVRKIRDEVESRVRVLLNKPSDASQDR